MGILILLHLKHFSVAVLDFQGIDGGLETNDVAWAKVVKSVSVPVEMLVRDPDDQVRILNDV